MTTAAVREGPALSLRQYRAIAATALRQALAERGAIVGRLAFYAVILLIFSRLWALVAERGGVEGAGSPELIWYLAVTEWVMLSLPPLQLDIERDVRTGDVAYRLARPVSYLAGRLAEAAGDTALRAGTLGIAGCGLAYALSGSFPEDPRGLLLALPLGLLAAWLGLVSLAAIGLSAFWLQDVSPLYWIWQKAAFVLGGLLLPLEVYPDWLRTVAMWTPFSALMHGPGRLAFGYDPGFAAFVAVRLVLWGALGTALLLFIYRRALRVVDVNGG